jgi:hypothetical protein
MDNPEKLATQGTQDEVPQLLRFQMGYVFFLKDSLKESA